MKIETTRKDIIWNYIGVLVSFGYGIVMMPFSVYFLDSDTLGLWYVFQSIGAIAVLLDFGFSPTFGRNINYCWSGATQLKKEGAVFSENSEPDFRLMKKVLKTCKFIYGIISAAALVLLLTAGSGYVLYVTDFENAKVFLTAWVIYAAAVFMNIYFGYCGSFLRGVGAVAENNKAVVTGRVIQIVLTIVLLACGFGIIGCSVAYLSYGVTFRSLANRKFYKYKNIGKRLDEVKEKVEKAQIKEMFSVIWHNAWRDGLVSLSSYLLSQASTIICSLFLTLAQTGVYSLTMQVASVISNVASALYSTQTPVMQSAYVTKDEAKMKRAFSVSVVSYIVIFIVGIIGFSTVGIPLLRIIKPDEPVTVALALGVGLSQFVIHFRNCYTSYFSCTNRLPYVRSLVFSSVFSVALSALLMGAFDLGLIGLIASQIISQAIYNLWVWPVKVHREMKLSFGGMFKECVSLIKSKIG